MAEYGSVRHPLYSIGEGTFREKEQRMIKQGLMKKKKENNNAEKPLKVVVGKDDMWMPKQLMNSNNMKTGNIFNKDIKKKIWGGK